MRVNLTIDQGNSSAKMAIWADSELLAVTQCSRISPEELGRIVHTHKVERAIYSSVVDDGAEVSRWLNDLGVKTFVLSTDLHLPVAVAYRTPATLGKDRIAAACGAWSRYPGRTALVVDIGTAITYDCVDADGTYLGGNIAPGPWMRLQALHRFTAKLPEVTEQGSVALWACDTAESMRSGALMGVAAELHFYRSKLPAGAVTLITGGDAAMVEPLLDFDYEYLPNLVSEGLNCILRYNETE